MSTAHQPNLGADGDAKAPTATTPIGNTIVDHVFERGDRVRVVKGHKKFGMSGIICRKTKAYVFFTVEETEEVKIMPKFLELVVRDTPSRDRDQVGKQQHQHHSCSEHPHGILLIHASAGDAVIRPEAHRSSGILLRTLWPRKIISFNT